MKEISINLKHCFGIKSLDFQMKFDAKNIAVIYAPNGTMKSSFANSLDYYSSNKQPIDRINPENKSICEIMADHSAIRPENITVIKGDDMRDSSKMITTFLASKKLKEKYINASETLDKALKNILSVMQKSSGSKNCENEIVAIFGKDGKSDILSCFKSINEYTQRDYGSIPNFPYHIVFDTKDEIKKFLNKHTDIIADYIENYNNLLSSSTFFSKQQNGTSFGTIQASNLEKSLSDNTFFDAKHTLRLCDGTEIQSLKQYKDLLDKELQSILQDDALKSAFKQIDNALSKNASLRRSGPRKSNT